MTSALKRINDELAAVDRELNIHKDAVRKLESKRMDLQIAFYEESDRVNRANDQRARELFKLLLEKSQ